MGKVDLAGLRAALIGRGWIDMPAEEAEDEGPQSRDDHISMIYRPDKYQANWPSIFVSENGFVSLSRLAWKITSGPIGSGGIEHSPGGFFLAAKDAEGTWSTLGVIRKYIDAADI